MIIVEKNIGPKIEYEIQNTATKKKITFDDDLTINLAKRQEDYAVHIDVCYDEDDALVLGAAAGRRYVAELDIPARQYDVDDSGEEPVEQAGVDRDGVIYKQVCPLRPTCLRRMRNSVSAMHLETKDDDKDRLALYQQSGLWLPILP